MRLIRLGRLSRLCGFGGLGGRFGCRVNRRNLVSGLEIFRLKRACRRIAVPQTRFGQGAVHFPQGNAVGVRTEVYAVAGVQALAKLVLLILEVSPEVEVVYALREILLEILFHGIVEAVDNAVSAELAAYRSYRRNENVGAASFERSLDDLTVILAVCSFVHHVDVVHAHREEHVPRISGLHHLIIGSALPASVLERIVKKAAGTEVSLCCNMLVRNYPILGKAAANAVAYEQRVINEAQLLAGKLELIVNRLVEHIKVVVHVPDLGGFLRGAAHGYLRQRA